MGFYPTPLPSLRLREPVDMVFSNHGHRLTVKAYFYKRGGERIEQCEILVVANDLAHVDLGVRFAFQIHSGAVGSDSFAARAVIRNQLESRAGQQSKMQLAQSLRLQVIYIDVKA